MLHLIFQSPIEPAILERIDAGDIAVFLENAVLRVLQHSVISHSLMQLLASNRLFVLSDDIAVRGITPDELINGLEVINYTELVELTVTHRLIQSWT